MDIKKIQKATIILIFFILITKLDALSQSKIKPNIVIICADDLGYGDLSCYGADKINTPNIDALADSGIRFTQAYSTSAVCTPSRFSLLTGAYPWRYDGVQIADGDDPLRIPTDKFTLPTMLKQAGYKSAVIGKWHLGIGDGIQNWNGALKPGPLEIGFDYSFIIPATGDRVPCVYVENHNVVNLDPKDPIKIHFKENISNRPTGLSNPELLIMKADTQHSGTIINGISRIGYMSGGEDALWDDEDIANRLNKKVIQFIEDAKDEPFFLFFALHDIHVPRYPGKEFRGKSEMGLRGDAILQADWCVGEVVKILKKNNLYDNTIVIFSSDNGPVLNDGYDDLAEEKVFSHKITGDLRGGKYSSYEGGTRVPFIISWGKHLSPSICDVVFCQVDLLSSFAALVNVKIPNGEAEDSMNNLETLLGKDCRDRPHLVQEVFGNFSLRAGKWKYIPASIGRSIMEDKSSIETGRSPVAQLYNLSDDINENNNLAEFEPEIVEEMELLLKTIINESCDRVLLENSY